MAALSAAEIRFLLVVALCSAPEMQQTPTTAMPRIKARYLIFIVVIRFCVVANTPVCDFPARKESHVLWEARSGLYAFCIFGIGRRNGQAHSCPSAQRFG